MGISSPCVKTRAAMQDRVSELSTRNNRRALQDRQAPRTPARSTCVALNGRKFLLLLLSSSSLKCSQRTRDSRKNKKSQLQARSFEKLDRQLVICLSAVGILGNQIKRLLFTLPQRASEIIDRLHSLSLSRLRCGIIVAAGSSGVRN